jgi:hypothetical protein
MTDIIHGDDLERFGSPIYHCPFDGIRCRIFEALRRRESGLYFAVECVIDKNDNNFHKCSRYNEKRVRKPDTHHCPFDGDLCKYVRGCQDVFFFANELPLTNYCHRAKIKRKVRWN